MCAMRSVLVVDDEEDIRLLIRHVLEHAGYRVVTADDGQEAIENLRSFRPDLVLLDLMMPRVDGRGVLTYLKVMPAPPPVIIVSGGGREELAGNLGDSVAAFFSKPFRIPELLSACERVITNTLRDAASSEGERRRAPRREFISDVMILSRAGGPMAMGRLTALSTHGARFEIPLMLEPGQPVRLAFALPGDDENLLIEAVVRTCDRSDENVVVGVAFTALSPEGSRRLREKFFVSD